MQPDHITTVLQSPLQDPPGRESRVLSVMRQHALLFYFLIAYAITWSVGFGYIVVLNHSSNLPIWFAFLLTTGPTASAFIMSAITEGRAGVVNLLRRYVLWRVNIVWYLVVLVVTPLMILVAGWLTTGVWAFTSYTLIFNPALYFLILFFGGPFFEEPGWRGFALPRLQERFGPLRASLLLGVLWAFWHLPLFFIPGYNGAGTGFIGISAALLNFMVATTLITVIFTWVFNNVRGSLLLTILLHACINTTSGGVSSATGEWIMAGVLAGVVVLLLITTRGRLSYDRYKRDQEQLTITGK
jgi:uncharacterized protein